MQLLFLNKGTMEVNKLYKLERGNQNQTVGLIVNGAGASVEVYCSAVCPTALSDMHLAHDPEVNATLDAGPWSFSTLPEYVYIVGTADSINIVDRNATDLNITF